MPYRRLPKTVEARLRALKTILANDDIYTVQNHVLEWDTITAAQNLYAQMQETQEAYKIAQTIQASSTAKYRHSLKTTRMFISHFIQVLNMAMARGEIKENRKPLYALSVGDGTVPELVQEQQVVEWGAHIIQGEKERLKDGGVPIYNPTIAKVAVQYDIFMDLYNKRTQRQEQLNQYQAQLAAQGREADAMILDIWNRVEEHFKALPPEERIAKCAAYGIVYYYRRGENKI